MRLLEFVWRQVLWLQTPLCSAGPIAAAAAPGTNSTGGHRQPLQPHCLQHLMLPECEQFSSSHQESGLTPTLHVVAERSLQLCQRVAPGTKLQQPQRHRDAQRGCNHVGAVLRLGEHLVEADCESGVELCHAVLKAAVTAASLRQPKANEERSHWQVKHILRRWGGRVHKVQQGGPKTQS